MLPAHPPYSRRRPGTRNDTLRMCNWLGRICSAKRPSKVMMVSDRTQAVGDVARAPPVLATQARHQERHIEDVQLAGQDLLGEATLEGHDGVKRQGTANEDGHGCVSNSQG